MPATLFSSILLLAGIASKHIKSIFFSKVCFFLSFLYVLPIINQITIDSLLVLGLLVLLVSVCITLFITQSKVGNTLLNIASPIILFFPINFFYQDPIQNIVNPSQTTGSYISDQDTNHPLIFIVFDELPITSLLNASGDIDKKNFPAFARLAENGNWFRNTYTLSEDTETSLPVILSGTVPNREKISSYQDHPRNLFTLFGKDTRRNVYESITHLCPPDICNRKKRSLTEFLPQLSMDVIAIYLNLISPKDLDLGLPDISKSWSHFWTIEDATTEQKTLHKYLDRPLIFNNFINKITNKTSNQVNFLHILLPHVPMYYLPSGKKYTLANYLPGMEGEKWGSNESLVIQAQQRHLLQLSFTDKLLGELFARLDKEKIFDESLIIVTADHGVGFWPGESRRSVQQTHPEDIIRVPLFVKEANQKEGAVFDHVVQTVDILPTLIDLLDINVNWKVDGHSLFSIRNENTQAHIATRTTTEVIYPVPGIAATLKRKTNYFGNNGDQFFGGGVPTNLIGQSVNDQKIILGDHNSFELNEPNLFEDLALNLTFVPALISGRVFGKKEGDTYTIAIAVNDIIQGFGQVNHTEDASTFSLLVPEKSFLSGLNKIRLFRVFGTEAHNGVLQEIPQINKMEYNLVGTSNSLNTEKIVSSEGIEYYFSKKNLRGHLDGTLVKDNLVKLVGWAADVIEPEPHMSIVVFNNNKSISIRETGTKRAGVARLFNNEDLLHSGFAFHIPLESIGKDNDIRVFVISEKGFARELVYYKDYDL